MAKQMGSIEAPEHNNRRPFVFHKHFGNFDCTTVNKSPPIGHADFRMFFGEHTMRKPSIKVDAASTVG